MKGVKLKLVSVAMAARFHLQLSLLKNVVDV